MVKLLNKNFFNQIKSVALLIAIFALTISFTSAAYQYTPPTVPATPEPGGDYGIPLTLNPTKPEWKWTSMGSGTNLSLNGQGSPALANINGSYGVSQDGRYKEAFYSEKMLSLGDVLTRTIPGGSQADYAKQPSFLESNTRSGGTTGGNAWSVPNAGLFTYKDYENIGRADSIGDDLTASADTLELFGTDMGGTYSTTDKQMNVITIKQGGTVVPRFTVEKTQATDGYDGSTIPLFAKLRAGILMAEKAILGQHVAPSNPASSETTDTALLAKINDSNALNLEGTSNIGYGDTCQLYGKTTVANGCPDGWYMVAHNNDCMAKCRKITRIPENPAEYGRCPALATPDSNSYKTDTAPITTTEFAGCSTSAVLPQCNDNIDNDGDGDTDFPDDPGCTSSSDNDETNTLGCNVGPKFFTNKLFGAQVCLTAPQTTAKTFSASIGAQYSGSPTTSGAHSVSITIPAGQLCADSTSSTMVCGGLGNQFYSGSQPGGCLAVAIQNSPNFTITGSAANSGALTCDEI